MKPEEIAANLDAVRDRIERAARRAGRDPGEITLVGVTKTHPVEHVLAAYEAGLRHFGENRVEEASQKIPEFRRRLPGADVTWHMIGHVQSRKAGPVLALFDTVHSVDSLKLAERLNRLAEREDRPPLPILLECNVSGEAAKYGFELSDWQTDPAQLEAFEATCRQIGALERLRIQGLMTMAPIVLDPEATRPVFRALPALRRRLQADLPGLGWPHLSMGMTDDFEVAIEEGATLVRVGRAIFGARLP